MNQVSTDRLLIGELIDGNAEAIFIIDRNFEIVAWNKRCALLLGTIKELALGQPLANIYPPLQDEDFMVQAQLAMRTQASMGKKSYTLGNGRCSTPILPSFSPIKLDSVEMGCMVIMRETELLEDTHKVSKYKPLIAESPIATAIYRPDGAPKYFNRAYSKLWGATQGMTDIVIRHYNIFEDEQLREIGLIPFIERGFEGETIEIPPVAYNPYHTSSIRRLGLRQKKFVKGHIFPIKDAGGDVYEVVMVLTDITFQKQAEEILTDTHLKFQMLTLGLPGVIYEYEQSADGQSQFKYISEGCDQMFGFTPEEIMQDASLLNNVIHPDDLSGFLNATSDPSGRAIEWQWEGRIINQKGTRWIEGKSSPTVQKDGSTIRHGLLLDITDKKEVEAQYNLSEERLRLALQGADLGLWEWDLNNKKTIFNKEWTSGFGYDHHEMELQFDEWGKLIHPDDLAQVKKRLTDHLKGKTDYYEAEYRLKSKHGEYRWILDKGRAVKRDANGRVVKASGTYLDINDKKNSQLLIERNEELFTQLFENSPLGIVLLDDDHRVIQMNQGFKSIFGYNDDDIIGNQLNNILVPQNHRQEAMDINLLTASGEVGMLESHRMHKNGSLIPVIIYGVPVTLGNKTIGIYGIYVDITARTNAENELQIRNNELDNFVYKVSHDLRAPLSSILGLVNLAQHEQNDDDVMQYMGLIENRVKQLDSFINDVLSHSKNLKLEINLGAIDFHQIINNCFNDLSYLPNANRVNLELNVSSTPFYSDRWRINEIFRNLISNAIKYLNPGVESPYVVIDIQVTRERARIKFKDNGIGIERATLPKVFEMFYRATEYSEGSGIGLYIVKNAVEKLGGHIRVSSKPNVGTYFDIVIPNSKEAF